MGPIRWEAPPPKVQGGGPRRGARQRNWAVIGEALRDRPGEWAVVETFRSPLAAAACAHSIRAGKRASLGTGPYEAVSRTVGGEQRVYARYLGGSSTENGEPRVG